MRSNSCSQPNGPAHGMRLVAGGRLDATEQPRDESLEFAVSSRAGDRLEPWALPSSPAVVRVLERAAGAGLDPELAVRLCVEHALVRAALSAVGIDPRTIDGVAARTRFEQRSDDRDAAYARRLVQAADDVVRRPAPSLISVGIPLRLAGRLADVEIGALLRDADPARARAWELAALADGRTMSEWAAFAALRAQNARLRA